jgi:hypothetical protein
MAKNAAPYCRVVSITIYLVLWELLCAHSEVNARGKAARPRKDDGRASGTLHSERQDALG